MGGNLWTHAASAALCTEEHDLDNIACHALWLVAERLFTCVCTLRPRKKVVCLPKNDKNQEGR